jgi:hypothetical protein
MHRRMCLWDYTQSINRSFGYKAKEGCYVRIFGNYNIYLHSLRIRIEKLARDLLFFLFQKFVQTNFVFAYNVGIWTVLTIWYFFSLYCWFFYHYQWIIIVRKLCFWNDMVCYWCDCMRRQQRNINYISICRCVIITR